MSVNCSISLTEIFPNTEKHEIVAVIRDLTEISNMESMLKRRESSGRLKKVQGKRETLAARNISVVEYKAERPARTKKLLIKAFSTLFITGEEVVWLTCILLLVNLECLAESKMVVQKTGGSKTGLTAKVLNDLHESTSRKTKGVKFGVDENPHHSEILHSPPAEKYDSGEDDDESQNDDYDMKQHDDNGGGSETGTQASTDDKIKQFKNANKTGYRALTEGLRKEQSVIEKNLLKAQTVVHFQNEEAYIAEQGLKESSNMQTLQLHKTRMLEQRLARQREQRKEFEEYSIQQKLKSKEQQLKSNKLEHALQVLDFIKERKMLVMQKKEAFEDRM
eukprot:Nk52_evm1s2545 gene=Nk52_evmTU1s2545